MDLGDLDGLWSLAKELIQESHDLSQEICNPEQKDFTESAETAAAAASESNNGQLKQKFIFVYCVPTMSEVDTASDRQNWRL